MNVVKIVRAAAAPAPLTARKRQAATMGSRIRDDVQHPFECFCEVGSTASQPEPHVIRAFPENYRHEDVMRVVPKFVYPCDVRPVEYSKFSFVLTCVDSKWMYGFCRHEPSMPLALVFLSYLPLHDMLYELLEKMAHKIRLIETDSANNLIKISDEVEENPFRFPTKFIEILQELYFKRPPSLHRHELARIPKNANLLEYFCAVHYKVMISVMAALLHERRIIVRSKKPRRISACVQAANDLLYPLVWQHIFIPVLPKFLSDYLLAPMPFLIGVPDDVFKNINLEDIGTVVILDADKNVIESPYDDVKDLPPEVIANLLRELTESDPKEDAIPRAFLRTITYLIGGYKDALRRTHGRLQLDKEAFINSRGSSMKPFLEKLTTLQTFEQFIENRIELINSGATQSDEFEREYCNFEKHGKSFGVSRSNKISIGSLMRQVKEMTHPAVESAVESMKTGSRGVRTACRELKSRVDTTIHSEKNKHPGRLTLPGPSGFTKVKDDTFFTPRRERKEEHANNNGSLMSTAAWHSRENLNNDEYLYSSAKQKSLFHSLPLPPSTSPAQPLLPDSFNSHKVDETDDLIKLSDVNDSIVTASSNTDKDLLQEYGLDFEQFNISRRNWTTFEE